MNLLFTRKIILAVSFISALFAVAIFQFGTATLCNSTRGCSNFLGFMYPFFFMFAAQFPFSIITYFTSDSVFQSWKCFLGWWIPLSTILVLLTPETTGSSFVPFVGRGHIAIFLTVAVIVISLILIAYKSWQVRR